MASRKGTAQDGNDAAGADPTIDSVESSTEAVTSSGDAGSGPDRHADIAGLAYEKARDELVSIVSRLESGQASLEDSMSLWERGEALAAHCSRWLDGAEARLEARDRSAG